MCPFQIRIAQPADAEEIARLVNDAFRPERYYIDHDRTNPEEIRALISNGKFLLLLENSDLHPVRPGGSELGVPELAGCVYIERHGERGYFGLLAVDPKRQGAGIGTRLIALAEQDCRDAGCRFMDLTHVNLRAELSAYYRRFGYVESGTLPFPADQHPKVPIHLIQMSKPL